MKACHYCQQTEKEMRPYGPNGSWVCFSCATATPEREAEMKKQFGLVLSMNEAASPIGVAAITDDGVVPFNPDKLK